MHHSHLYTPVVTSLPPGRGLGSGVRFSSRMSATPPTLRMHAGTQIRVTRELPPSHSPKHISRRTAASTSQGICKVAVQLITT